MKELDRFRPIAQAIAQLLHPYAEVVIHELATKRIAAIYNNYSQRKEGDDSLLEEKFSAARLPDVFDVYYKTNVDGRSLKCTTATLRDSRGAAIGLLCINLDVSFLETVQAQLADFLIHQATAQLPKQLFKDDWKEKISAFVRDYCKKEHVLVAKLTRAQTLSLISQLHHRGAFKAKHAATYVGQVLGISRATVYNYLKEIS